MAGLWALYGFSFALSLVALGLLYADYLSRKKHHSR